MTDAAEDFLTIPEAAARLSTSAPRLRRLVTRPEWETRTKTLDRETRTGTRTALCVPVSILDELGQALADSHRESTSEKPEREQITTETRTVQSGNGNENGNDSPTLEGDLLREIITRQDVELVYLREALQREQSIAMAATTEAATLRQRLLSLASLESPIETPGGVDSRPDTLEAPSESPARQNEPNPSGPLPWWKRLFGAGR